MPSALDGLRILDLTDGAAGALGVLLLAEQGADVVKVEPPGGDPFRAAPGSPVWHRSRRSVVLDFDDAADREAFAGLCERADVVVESHRPGALHALGIGYEDLAPRCPRLVWCSVPAYPAGHRLASRPGADALVQARSGQQYEQPGWRQGPIFLATPMPSMAACFMVATGVVAALYERELTGAGQRVETSLYQGVLTYTTMLWQEVERPPAGYHAIMAKSYPPGVHQQTLFECASGEWVHAATMSGRAPTRTQEDVLGLEPANVFAMTPDERAAHAERTRDAFRARDRDELVAAFHEAGLGAEAVISMDDAFTHPQLVANGMVVTVDDPELGSTTQIGVPIDLSRTPGAVQGPRPGVGAHTAEVLADLDTPILEAMTHRNGGLLPRERGERGPGPLAGVRVLDLGQYLAGPFGPMILAALGADVVKIEPVAGDAMRLAAKPFVGCQRGKKGIAVDLKTEAGLGVVRRLAAGADVVHHNMTKGVAARLGVDYASLTPDNPGLVYCNTWAYGAEGPMSDFGGLDPLYQACTGMELEAGPVHAGNPPLYLRFGMCDTANALLSVVGVLLALYHRARTGEGQQVSTSLLNGAAVIASEAHLVDGRPAPRPQLDARQTGTSPGYRLYETQDGWIQVAAVSDDEWQAFCTAVGATDEAGIESALATRTSRAWQLAFDAAAVPAEIPLDSVEGELVLHDHDNVRLGLVTSYDHPILGRVGQFGDLITFSASGTPTATPPPMVGEHTRAVLTAAGWSDAEVDALVADGVVYEPDDNYRWTT